MIDDCVIAIDVNGLVVGACVCSIDRASFSEAITEWMSDRSIRQLVRVPVSVPRMYLYEEWPGLDAALETAGSK